MAGVTDSRTRIDTKQFRVKIISAEQIRGMIAVHDLAAVIERDQQFIAWISDDK